MDRRTSTSKTIAFAWTVAIAWGLLSLVIADILGDAAEWNGLQEEYLLLLWRSLCGRGARQVRDLQPGGQRQLDGEDGATAGQLVNNDEGDTDLGDLQYVLFNVIGLAYFLSQFIGELGEGFPDLPPTLTGLMPDVDGRIRSQEAARTVHADAHLGRARRRGAPQEGPGVRRQPRRAGLDGRERGALEPTVPGSVRTRRRYSAHDVVLGNDRLTVTVPATAKPGAARSA